MEIVNKVQSFSTTLSYDELKKKFPSYKAYTSRPTMLKVTYQTCCILFFKNGKCRIMGRAEDQNKILHELDIPIYNCMITTCTVKYFLNKAVKCHLLPRPHFLFEPELFIAASIRCPEFTNIFPSGAVIIMGVKSLQRARIIIDTILLLITPYLIDE